MLSKKNLDMLLKKNIKKAIEIECICVGSILKKAKKTRFSVSRKKMVCRFHGYLSRLLKKNIRLNFAKMLDKCSLYMI